MDNYTAHVVSCEKLENRRPLCGFSDMPPSHWPDGHKWTPRRDFNPASPNACDRCAVLFMKQTHTIRCHVCKEETPHHWASSNLYCGHCDTQTPTTGALQELSECLCTETIHGNKECPVHGPHPLVRFGVARIEKRRGRWKVSEVLLRGDGGKEALELLQSIAMAESESFDHLGRVHCYEGVSPHFDPIEDDEKPPEYQFWFKRDGDGEAVFDRVERLPASYLVTTQGAIDGEAVERINRFFTEPGRHAREVTVEEIDLRKRDDRGRVVCYYCGEPFDGEQVPDEHAFHCAQTAWLGEQQGPRLRRFPPSEAGLSAELKDSEGRTVVKLTSRDAGTVYRHGAEYAALALRDAGYTAVAIDVLDFATWVNEHQAEVTAQVKQALLEGGRLVVAIAAWPKGE
jgi:hypothetical protein